MAFAGPFILGVIAGFVLAIAFFSDPDRFPPEDE